MRQVILILLDIILINISMILALNLSSNFYLQREYYDFAYNNFYLYTPLTLGVILLCKGYKSMWRHASIEELLYVFVYSFFSTIMSFMIMHRADVYVPKTFYIIYMLLLMATTGGMRFFYRAIRRFKKMFFVEDSQENTLVIGAGEAGAMVIKELVNGPSSYRKLVGILDDDISKKTKMIHGIKVLGEIEHVEKVVEKFEITEIIIAIPSVETKRRTEIINKCKKTGTKLRIVPGIYELIDGKVTVNAIRDVEIEDLLGREAIKLDLGEVKNYIKDRVVMVTGGGGSIGSELCRQISGYSPKKLIIVDIYENNAYEIQQELVRKYKDELDLEVLIASVRDKNRLEEIFEQYRPQVVFHAAAHKHVPLMEKSPMEAIKNNVFGTLNTVELSHKYKVARFVLISTDKAVNPTNIMGATKRICELIVQSHDKISSTEFVAVRFGNVLGSNGSVIPLFKRQIKEGGPVTVTHPDIIRYFMTIPEAVQLVLQAGSMANGGEIFVLDMGDPVKIADLAKDLIRLSGFEPGKDIEIIYSGLRPGEKLYEELLMAEEGLTNTSNEKIFIGQPMELNVEEVKEKILNLKECSDIECLKNKVQNLVPTYVGEK